MPRPESRELIDGARSAAVAAAIADASADRSSQGSRRPMNHRTASAQRFPWPALDDPSQAEPLQVRPVEAVEEFDEGDVEGAAER